MGMGLMKDDEDNKKLLSKESWESNPSFRVYYGDVSSAVPFMWESRPGTPKHTFSADNNNNNMNMNMILPAPLTPPPSYCYYNSTKHYSPKKQSTRSIRLFLKKSRINLINKLSSSSSNRSRFHDSRLNPGIIGTTKENGDRPIKGLRQKEYYKSAQKIHYKSSLTHYKQ
ncbi:hypothetical protein ACJIZ3_022215 [Penstemon smallii]|uniref:Uncharacterized protein n=1 Tax=Penstemon smallii TaxID=265156 RepID=A0ABD3SP93_9LAMI